MRFPFFVVRSIVVIFLSGACTLQAAAQTAGAGKSAGKPEYASKAGTKYYAQPDPNGTVAEAEKKLAADPKNVDLILALGRAQGGVWRFRDAIATYTGGLKLAPSDARLLVARGHRYISTRQPDKALADLKKAAGIDAKAEGLWYHLGLAHYLRGEFANAAAAFGRRWKRARAKRWSLCPRTSGHRERGNAMIARIWHGWTKPENADAYETLLRAQILPGIRKAAGCRGIRLFWRPADAEVEFVTLLFFDSLDAVKVWAGEHFDVAVVPPEARKLLAHFDERSRHYETALEL